MSDASNATPPLAAPEHGQADDALFKLRRAIGGSAAEGNPWATEISERLDDYVLALAASHAEEREPDFWAVLRDDNEMLATGDTRQAALAKCDEYGQAQKGNRCVAIFTDWPVAAAGLTEPGVDNG